jgi:ribosomal protein S14
MRKLYYKFSKNHALKHSFLKYECQYKFNKALFKEFYNIKNINIQIIKASYKPKLKYTRHRHICLLSGRARGFLNTFMLSRMYFKKLALNGFIVGMQKAS